VRGVSPSDCIFKNNSYLSLSLSLAPSHQRSKQNQATQSEQEESEQHTAQGEKRDDETTGRPTTTTRPRYSRIGPGKTAAPRRVNAAPRIGGRRLGRHAATKTAPKAKGSERCTKQRRRRRIDDRSRRDVAVAHSAPPHSRAATVLVSTAKGYSTANCRRV
jgi:hypothetical protein